jgi:hypothetical protein
MRTRRAVAPPGGRHAAGFRRSLLALGLILAAWPAAAQIGGDNVPTSRTVEPKEEIDADLQKARFRLGPMRLLPAVFVTNAGYDSNVFLTKENPISDYTATVNFGTRMLAPLGPKMYIRGDAFPQYVWYDKLDERRRFGGNYASDLFGFFNRLTFRLHGQLSQNYTNFSSEFNAAVRQKTPTGSGNLDIAITHALSFYAGGSYADYHYEQVGGPPGQNLQVSLSNRKDTSGEGGFYYHVNPDWDVGALVQSTWSSFDVVPDQRDNRSIAYLGAIRYNRQRLFVNVMAGYRVGLPTGGSSFIAYQRPSGSFFVSFFPIRWLELQAVGDDHVVYSVDVVNPYYTEERVGGSVNIEVLDRVLLHGEYTVGPNEYPIPVILQGEPVTRVDHTRLYGGGLSVKVIGTLVLTGRYERQFFVSTIPENTRNFVRITAFLSFSGEYTR